MLSACCIFRVSCMLNANTTVNGLQTKPHRCLVVFPYLDIIVADLLNRVLFHVGHIERLRSVESRSKTSITLCNGVKRGGGRQANLRQGVAQDGLQVSVIS